ncbi:MAG: hypothetical protein ACRD0Q_11790 [Acidimicrobiales bacterium]
MRRSALALATALLAGVVGVVGAVPASAHTVTGVSPTNYRSEVVSVVPAVRGLRLRLLDLGRRVEVVNDTSTDVVVLGYEGEPYLRVGPSGVYENRRSPAVWLNRADAETEVGDAPPPSFDAAAPPSWRRTGDGQALRWRDRRTRWEGVDPPAVQASPERPHLVSQWTVELRHTVPVTANGRIVWVPGPSAATWLLTAVVLLGLTASLGWSRRWGPALAGATAALVAVDAVHSISTAVASGGSVLAIVVAVVFGGFLSVMAWVAGVFAVGRLQREDEWGLWTAGVAALLIALYSLSDATSLGRSQVSYAFPPATARAAVAASLGIGLGLLVAVAAVLKRRFTPVPPNSPNR